MSSFLDEESREQRRRPRKRRCVIADDDATDSDDESQRTHLTSSRPARNQRKLRKSVIRSDTDDSSGSDDSASGDDDKSLSSEEEEAVSTESSVSVSLSAPSETDVSDSELSPSTTSNQQRHEQKEDTVHVGSENTDTEKTTGNSPRVPEKSDLSSSSLSVAPNDEHDSDKSAMPQRKFMTRRFFKAVDEHGVPVWFGTKLNFQHYPDTRVCLWYLNGTKEYVYSTHVYNAQRITFGDFEVMKYTWNLNHNKSKDANSLSSKSPSSSSASSSQALSSGSQAHNLAAIPDSLALPQAEHAAPQADNRPDERAGAVADDKGSHDAPISVHAVVEEKEGAVDADQEERELSGTEPVLALEKFNDSQTLVVMTTYENAYKSSACQYALLTLSWATCARVQKLLATIQPSASLAHYAMETTRLAGMLQTMLSLNKIDQYWIELDAERAKDGVQ